MGLSVEVKRLVVSVARDKIESCTFYQETNLHVLLEAFSLPSGF